MGHNTFLLSPGQCFLYSKSAREARKTKLICKKEAENEEETLVIVSSLWGERSRGALFWGMPGQLHNLLLGFLVAFSESSKCLCFPRGKSFLLLFPPTILCYVPMRYLLLVAEWPNERHSLHTELVTLSFPQSAAVPWTAVATHRHPHPTGRLWEKRFLFAFFFQLSFLTPHCASWRILLLKRWLEFGLPFMWIAKDVESAFGGFPSVQSIQATENHNKWSPESMQRRDIIG